MRPGRAAGGAAGGCVVSGGAAWCPVVSGGAVGWGVVPAVAG